MTEADHPPQPEDQQPAIPAPPESGESGDPPPRPSTWARRPPVLTEVKSLFDQDLAEDVGPAPAWAFPRRAGPPDPSPRPPPVVAPDPVVGDAAPPPDDEPAVPPAAPPTAADFTPPRTEFSLPGVTGLPERPELAPVLAHPATRDQPERPQPADTGRADADSADPDRAESDRADPDLSPEGPPARSVASAAAVRWARESLATLGALDGRHMDRRAVDVNEHRIGKLEPEWNVPRRIRSFVILVVLTLFVAAVIAAVLAIAVEVLSVAVNHAVSKSAGA